MLLSSSTYTDGVQRMQIKAMLSAVHWERCEKSPFLKTRLNILFITLNLKP
jgi:hypothetical protein